LQEIYDEIIAEKETLTSLSDLVPSGTRYTNLLAELSTASKVAIWRLWAYVVATAIFAHESLFDSFASEVETASQEAIWGTAQWYHQNTLKFQYGYTLVFDGQKYGYTSDDPSAKIIAFAAVQERVDGLLVLKVAKAGPSPLTSTELAAFQAYAEQTKFAGTRLSCVSFPADSLKLYYTVYYDPILPLTTVSQRVENAINEYLKALPFNGKFRINLMTDKLQDIDGIIDPVFTSAEAKYGALPYQGFVNEYLSNAGYLKIDPAFPLSSTIQYLPYE
jgi:hypothetical protein